MHVSERVVLWTQTIIGVPLAKSIEGSKNYTMQRFDAEVYWKDPPLVCVLLAQIVCELFDELHLKRLVIQI